MYSVVMLRAERLNTYLTIHVSIPELYNPLLKINTKYMACFIYSGIVPPGTGPRGDDQAILLSPNHVFPEENGNSIGISRSATASPVPQSTMSTAWMSCRKMIYVKTNPRMNTPIGHWPIPESTWPDPSLQTLVSDVH